MQQRGFLQFPGQCQHRTRNGVILLIKGSCALRKGFRGYGMGYRSVVRDSVSACKTRTALLLRFLSETGNEVKNGGAE